MIIRGLCLSEISDIVFENSLGSAEKMIVFIKYVLLIKLNEGYLDFFILSNCRILYHKIVCCEVSVD